MPRPPCADRRKGLASGAWGEHAWKSENWLVNASTLWALMLSGSLMEVDPAARKDPGDYFRAVAGRVGEPGHPGRHPVRPCAFWANSFVLGPATVKAAIRRGQAGRCQRCHYPALFSFDMLGRAAPQRPATRGALSPALYGAIAAAVAAARQDGPVEAVDGVSVKLSALHPRYNVLKSTGSGANSIPKVLEQGPKLRKLVANIGFCLDAEES